MSEDLYERGIRKLIEIVKRSHNSDWSPTPLLREIEEIAKQLEEIADLLARHGSAQSHIQAVHDEPEEPTIGTDGWRVEPAENAGQQPSYEATEWLIRNLADSAREAADRLPDPREKHALRFAAGGLLHLRHDYEFPPPVLSDNSADVNELDRVCRAAGIYLSRVTLRGALAKALADFDPHFMDGYRELYR